MTFVEKKVKERIRKRIKMQAICQHNKLRVKIYISKAFKFFAMSENFLTFVHNVLVTSFFNLEYSMWFQLLFHEKFTLREALMDVHFSQTIERGERIVERFAENFSSNFPSSGHQKTFPTPTKQQKITFF